MYSPDAVSTFILSETQADFIIETRNAPKSFVP